MTTLKMIALLALSNLLLSGCANGDPASAGANEDQAGKAAKEPEKPAQYELILGTGGGTSREFRRALAGNYRPLRVSLVAGTTAPSKGPAQNSAADEFVVGIESPEGKRILGLLEELKPWEWESAKGLRFANNLYLSGNSKEKSWKYASVYPDQKLESLLIRLREALSGKKQNTSR